MKGINKVILLGIVGADPQLRYTVRQNPICHFSLATHRRTRNADGDVVEKTDWHTIVVFDKWAEFIATAIKKGSKVYVEGMLEYQDIPHKAYKDVTLHKCHVEAMRIEVIDGLVYHPYPEDFPPLKSDKRVRTVSSSHDSPPDSPSISAVHEPDLFDG